MATRSKLAVILHADVVGSTALVQKDERVAHERIQNSFQRLGETITAYGGVTHEVRGDALVAVMGRASDGVSATLAFQVANTEQNAVLADDIRPEIRVIRTDTIHLSIVDDIGLIPFYQQFSTFVNRVRSDIFHVVKPYCAVGCCRATHCLEQVNIFVGELAIEVLVNAYYIGYVFGYFHADSGT